MKNADSLSALTRLAVAAARDLGAQVMSADPKSDPLGRTVAVVGRSSAAVAKEIGAEVHLVDDVRRDHRLTSSTTSPTAG